MGTVEVTLLSLTFNFDSKLLPRYPTQSSLQICCHILLSYTTVTLPPKTKKLEQIYRYHLIFQTPTQVFQLN